MYSVTECTHVQCRIINFCNQNSGFISAILSIVTIVLSICAIVISIKTAMLPYTKKLRIYTGLDFDEDGNYTMEIYLYNLGNSPVYIKSIEVSQKEIAPLCLARLHSEIPMEKHYLIPHMFCSFTLPLENCNAADNHENSYIDISIDTETKVFRKRINWAVG